MRKILYSALLLLFGLFFVFSINAQNYRDDYNVDYNIQQSNQDISTTVNFNVKITNLRSDLYVKKFTLTFPKSFAISNLKASDDSGPISAQVNQDQNNIQINVEFNNPYIGKGTSNNFYLTFNQNNLFKVSGNVWEVILPTILGQRFGDYIVKIHLPQDTNKKISIAKPKPDQISGNVISWKNPTGKTIYAVFGDKQFYNLNLTYSVENPKLYRVYTDVAFPPDMLHQKIYVTQINPAPVMTYIDEDGNFMGRYYLNPRETKTITFQGLAELSVAARPEIQVLNQKQLFLQKPFLLSQTKYWKIDQIDKYSSLKTPADIFNFIDANFSYDYQRFNSNNIQRLGATFALANPTKAMCLEFTDAFVALAREKGIYSREIEGYGFSSDAQLRPMSLLTDILHAWPEYYDPSQQQWITIDPTWQNTSGIDYFNSLDLNHIAFAIHGKRADYPLPAGMYKTNKNRNVKVQAVTSIPVQNNSLIVSHTNLVKQASNGKVYNGIIYLKNNGNVFQYDLPINLSARDLQLSQSDFIVAALAPGEEKAISFSYQPTTLTKSGGIIILKSDGKQLYSTAIKPQPVYYAYVTKLAILFLVLCTIFLLFKAYRHWRKK